MNGWTDGTEYIFAYCRQPVRIASLNIITRRLDMNSCTGHPVHHEVFDNIGRVSKQSMALARERTQRG